MKQNIKSFFDDILSDLSSLKELEQITGFKEELNRLKKRLSDNEFRIAVVGEFSSGKSTFINALLGKDILSHATTETTAVLTRIINVMPTDKRCGTGKIYMRNGTTTIIKNLDNLKEYTTTKSDKYNVVDEIAKVELYLSLLNDSRPIVIVDTPGLNGTASGHKEQTVEIIKEAHACLYLLPKRGFSDTDNESLQYLSKYQGSFIFIQNFIDTFNASEGETAESKIAEDRHILENKIFKDKIGIKYNICGISALKELASVDKNIKRLYNDSKTDLTDEDRKKLHIESNFDSYTKLMNEIFSADNLAEIQYGGTARAIDMWIKSLRARIETRYTQAQEAYELSKEDNAIIKLDRIEERILNSQERQKNNLTNFIVARCMDIKRSELLKLENDINKLKDLLRKKINNFINLTDLEKNKQYLSVELQSNLGMIQSSLYKRLERHLQNVHEFLLQKIEDYSGIKRENIDLTNWHLNINTGKITAFKQSENNISEYYQREIDKQTTELVKFEEENNHYKSSIEIVNNKIDIYNDIIRCTESDKKKKLSNLGSEPAIEKKEEKYIDQEDFLIFFKKDVEKTCFVKDDSKRQEWYNRKAKITNTYNSAICDLQNRKIAEERRLDRLRRDSQIAQQRIEQVMARIKRLEDNKRQEKDRLRVEREKAEKEYVINCKKILIKQVEEYLSVKDAEEGIFQEIKTDIENQLNTVKEALTIDTLAKFEKAVEAKLTWIEKSKEKKNPELVNHIKILSKTKEKLNTIIDKMGAYFNGAK